MATIEELAGEAYEWFERAYRVEGDDSTRFVRVKDGAPDWIGDMCRQAHGDMFPDDWKYECIRAAVGAIADDGYDEDNDSAHAFADDRVGVYTTARTAWLASHLDRVGIVQEAIAEYGAAENSDIAEMIGWGMYVEARDVYETVARCLADRVEEVV